MNERKHDRCCLQSDICTVLTLHLLSAWGLCPLHLLRQLPRPAAKAKAVIFYARYRYIQKKLLNHSLNVENAIVSSPNHVLFIWLGFAPFLFLLIVSRDRQEIRAFRLISNELIIPRGACPDLTEWGHAVESADEPVGQKTKEKHRGKKNTVLSKGKWCFKALLLHTVVKYANQPGRRWEHKQYWVSPDALSQLEERGIKHKGH